MVNIGDFEMRDFVLKNAEKVLVVGILITVRSFFLLSTPVCALAVEFFGLGIASIAFLALYHKKGWSVIPNINPP